MSDINKNSINDAVSGSSDVKENVPGKRKKSRIRVIIVLAVVILGIALAAFLVITSVMSKNSYESTVKAYMTAHIASDYDQVISIRSGFYDAGIMMKSEKVSAMISNVKDAMRLHSNAFKESLGEDYEVTYEVITAEKMDRAVFESMLSAFTILGYDASAEIEEAMMVDVQLTAKNNNGKKTADLTMVLTKEEDGWKFFGLEGSYS